MTKEERKQYNKQWRLKNKEYHKQWHKNNPEYMKRYFSQLESGVYMVKNLINGKKYIGQSIKPQLRKCAHASIGKMNNSNPNIQIDLKQYGRDTFVFGIIEHCKPEQLLEREQYYINLLNPEYNVKNL